MTERQIQKELERQRGLFEEECKNGFQSKAVKFETLCEEWFAEYAKQNLRHTTYSYLYHHRVKICKAIGHLRMDKLTARQIQAFVNLLSKEGANEINGNPLSPRTIQHNLNLISDIFGYTVKKGVIAANPCKNMTVPQNQSKEKEIYTADEVCKVLTLLNSEPLKYRAFFNLAIYSGFRRGEMLDLEWKDVDFEHNVISVRRTSCYTADRGVYTDTTKTKLSQRSLKFPQALMDILKGLKNEQDDEALKQGSKWVETDRLFTKENGEPQCPNTTYHWLERFFKKNGIPFRGLHCFRHTFASFLVNEGVDIVTVSGTLGHSNVTTTSNIYCHILGNSIAKVSEAKNNALNFSDNKGA